MRHPRKRRNAAALLLPLATLLAGSAALAEPLPEDVPLAQLLDIIVLESEVLAVDATSGGQLSVSLQLGESVRWTGTRGQVGVVLTDRRILAVSTRSGFWQSLGYRLTEVPPRDALLGDRVALLMSSERAIGFDGRTGNLVEADLGPRERVLTARVGENVAVAVTERRALGLSPQVGGFFPVKLGIQERVESLTATANLATLQTSRRLLFFRAPTASWEERRLPIN